HEPSMTVLRGLIRRRSGYNGQPRRGSATEPVPDALRFAVAEGIDEEASRGSTEQRLQTHVGAAAFADSAVAAFESREGLLEERPPERSPCSAHRRVAVEKLAGRSDVKLRAHDHVVQHRLAASSVEKTEANTIGAVAEADDEALQKL